MSAADQSRRKRWKGSEWRWIGNVPRGTHRVPGPRRKPTHLQLYLFALVASNVLGYAVAMWQLTPDEPERVEMPPLCVVVKQGDMNSALLMDDSVALLTYDGEKWVEYSRWSPFIRFGQTPKQSPRPQAPQPGPAWPAKHHPP